MSYTTTTRRWLLNQKPTGPVQLSGPNATFTLTETTLPPLKENQLLLKTLYLSNDPIQRSWISPSIDPQRFYRPKLMQPGDVIDAFGIVVVAQSTSQDFKEGDYVFAETGWSEYSIVDTITVQPAPELPGGLSRTHYLGALGSTGLTAYLALTDHLSVGPKDIIIISGAAGATGSMAVQIAKHVLNCRTVIGVAGSEEKCRWVESLGADVCLNYKSSRFEEELLRATPEFSTVFLDLVGGKVLDAVLKRMAKKGRVAAVGNVANYNDQGEGLKNWYEVVAMGLQIKGFNLVYYEPSEFTPAMHVLRKAVEEGKLQIEGGEQVVQAKFEDVPKIWMRLFEGGNTGKLVTELV